MKKICLMTFLSCALAGTLAMTTLACSDDDDSKDGDPSTSGTGCPALVCDATGNVKSSSTSTSDEYAANAGCIYKDLGTCADGCDMSRELTKLPGCDVGSACNAGARTLPAAGSVTSATSCSASRETLEDTESCGGYPCLSRHTAGMGVKPFFCATQRCNTDADCPSDHFCRCFQEEVSSGAFTSERWCVQKTE